MLLESGGAFLLASSSLISTINGYENYIERKWIDETVIEAYVEACSVAINNEKDTEYGLQLTKRSKELIERYCMAQTGGTIWDLEKYAFANKSRYDLIDKFHSVLLLEAQNKVVDSFFRYIEHKREPKERFYMPRRKQFLKIGLVDALQGMIDDKYDILCISLIPGAGKTTIEKFFNAAVIGWYPKDFNLFYSHSGDITRMYYDGMYDIVTNADEYAWNEIFPDLQVTSTNAKVEQFNVGKYKSFPSVQCTSVGSKNAGKVRASKFLLVDDMIGGIEEALNPMILEKLWSKYSVDARQRKIQDTDGKNCKEIHIATRWSVHDVIGRIQNMYVGNPRVKVIAVPDIDPVTGRSNFDYEFSGFDVAFFEDQQLLMDEISYKCLYKQEPIEREGLLFPDDKIRRYLNLPHGTPELITAQCDTKGKGTDYFVLPVLQKYGDDYYCVDAVCDNTADYEMQYENAANILVNNEVQECEFERNAGGDRVAMEVNKRVESKGWICNITDTPTETNKEARIFQCSSWILQHVIFKDPSKYKPNEPYGIMMSLLKQYSVSGKKQLDDVPDVFSNFAIRVTSGNRVAKVEAAVNPFRRYA
nr:MAG TPA: Terminase [Caudoviricetes sp.]